MSTSELRQHAAELIKKHGWVQGWYGDCWDGYCITGALLEAACQQSGHSFGPSEDWPREALNAIGEIAQRISERGCPPGMHAEDFVAEFNDAPGRVIEDILGVLEP